MPRRANVSAIIAVVVALSVVVGSGAFTSALPDRGATLEAELGTVPLDPNDP